MYVTQIGRAIGNEIVQEGEESPSLARLYGASQDSGPAATIRWIFSEIGARSFRWRSERSSDRVHWQLQREFFVRRVGA